MWHSDSSYKRRVGDLAMWDDQATLRHSRPHDDKKYPRDLRRTTHTCGMPAMAMARWPDRDAG